MGTRKSILERDEKSITISSTKDLNKVLDNAEEIEDELDENDSDNDLSSDYLELDAIERGKTDIFVDKINPLRNAGEFPKVHIYLNGDMVHTTKEQIDWEWIQQNLAGNPKYGSGSYKVRAHRDSGRFLGSQVMNIKAPLTSVYETHQSNNQNNNSSEMIDFVRETINQNNIQTQNLLKEIKGEKNRESGQMTELLASLIPALTKRDDNSSSMTVMMQMMMENNNNIMKMQMENQRSTQELISAMNEKTDRNMRDMSDRFRESIAALKESSKENFSSFEMFKMMKESEDTGFEKAQAMAELIEAKAALRATDKDEDSSLAGTLVKSMSTLVPLLTGLNGGIQPNVANSTPTQPRGVLTHTTGNRNAPQAPQRPVAQPQNATNQRPSVFNRQSGLQPREKASEIVKQNPIEVEAVEISNKTVIISDREREDLINTVMPVVGFALINGVTASQAVEQCLDTISKLPYYSEELVKELPNIFTLNFILDQAEKNKVMEMAQQQNMVEAVKEWFKEFYEALSQKS